MLKGKRFTKSATHIIYITLSDAPRKNRLRAGGRSFNFILT